MSEEARRIVEEVLREQGLWNLVQLLKKEHNLLRGTHNLKFENLLNKPPDVDLDGPITILQNGDTMVLSLDGTHAYFRWSDGAIIFKTNEGTNSNSVVVARGKGTGVGVFSAYDQDDAEALDMWADSGIGFLRVNGTSPGELRLGGASNYVSFEQDGEINLAGTARVTKTVWVPASGVRAPGTKPATWKEWGISGVWEFSDGTDDTVVANLQFPYDMDLTAAPVVSIGVSTNTAVTSETSVWQLEYLYTAPGENTAANAQATITKNVNAVAQADGLVVATFPAMAVPGATDVCVHMRIKRLGADPADDLTDTAELHGLCMSYTSNKLGSPL